MNYTPRRRVYFTAIVFLNGNWRLKRRWKNLRPMRPLFIRRGAKFQFARSASFSRTRRNSGSTFKKYS